MRKIYPKPLMQLKVPQVFFSPHGVLADGSFIDKGEPAKFPIDFVSGGLPLASTNNLLSSNTVYGDSSLTMQAFHFEQGYGCSAPYTGDVVDSTARKSLGSNVTFNLHYDNQIPKAITLSDGRFITTSFMGDMEINSEGANPLNKYGVVQEGASGTGFSVSAITSTETGFVKEMEDGDVLKIVTNCDTVFGNQTPNRDIFLKYSLGASGKTLGFRQSNKSNLVLHTRKDTNLNFMLASNNGDRIYDPASALSLEYSCTKFDPIEERVRENWSDTFQVGWADGDYPKNNQLSNNLWRGIPVCRAVNELVDSTELFVMYPEYVSSGNVTKYAGLEHNGIGKLGIRKLVHDAEGYAVHSVKREMEIVNQDGTPFVPYERDIPRSQGGSINASYSVGNPTQAYVYHTYVTKFVEVGGETFLSAMFLPMSDVWESSPYTNMRMNLVQYTFKLDTENDNKLILQARQEIEGLFGLYGKGASSFMFGADNELFLITPEGILSAVFNPELMLWEPKDRNIAVKNVRSLHQTLGGDLWFTDADRNLYNLPKETSLTININYPDTIMYKGSGSTIEVSVSCRDLEGNYLAKELQLEIEGLAKFPNGSSTYTVLTSDTSPQNLTIELTGHGMFNIVVKSIV